MIRPYAYRSAEQAMRQIRKLNNSNESSIEPDQKDDPNRDSQKHHSGFTDSRHHTGHYSPGHHSGQVHGQIVEAKAVDAARDEQSINTELARAESIDSESGDEQPINADLAHAESMDSEPGDEQSINADLARAESIDSVENSNDLANEQTLEAVAIQSWVRLYNPLASYFPDLKTPEQLNSDSYETDSLYSDFESGNDHCSEPENVSWWQQERSYFNDYRYHNWGSAAFREMNLDSLRDAAEAMWSEDDPTPTPTAKPVNKPEPHAPVDDHYPDSLASKAE